MGLQHATWLAGPLPSAHMVADLEVVELGPEHVDDYLALFDAAFREYLGAWGFRHPSPADFFRLMRAAAEEAGCFPGIAEMARQALALAEEKLAQ